jgi:putative PIN family toxin of toxin-antitoxin system
VRRVVLDANVYISAILRPEGPPGQILERFLRDRAFEIVLSPAIVDETIRALAYPKVRRHIRPGVDTNLWFEDIIVLAHLVADADAAPAVSVDADDDKYLAAAIEGTATLVVSGDPDLLTIKEHQGVRIVTPRAFLDLLGPPKTGSK